MVSSDEIRSQLASRRKDLPSQNPKKNGSSKRKETPKQQQRTSKQTENRIVSEKNLVNSKNDKDGKIKIFWKSRKDWERALILLFSVSIIVLIAYAVFSPKLTPLSINEPVSLENNDIKMYSYENYSVSNSTSQIQIKGKSEPGATVTAYVIYDNLTYNGPNIPDDFRKYSAEFDPDSPRDAKENGKKIKIEVNQKGEFTFNITTNFDKFGDTWIYIIAQSPGKEENKIELILTYIKESTSEELTPPPDTTTSIESQKPVDTGAAYADGDTKAAVAIYQGDPNKWLPRLGGTYPDDVKNEPEEYKSWYDAGYLDRLKQEGYYP